MFLLQWVLSCNWCYSSSGCSLVMGATLVLGVWAAYARRFVPGPGTSFLIAGFLIARGRSVKKLTNNTSPAENYTSRFRYLPPPSMKRPLCFWIEGSIHHSKVDFWTTLDSPQLQQHYWTYWHKLIKVLIIFIISIILINW